MDIAGLGAAGYLAGGDGLGLPADACLDGCFLSGQGDVLDKESQELLAFGGGGGMGLPDSGEILSQGQDAQPFLWSEDESVQVGLICIFMLECFDLRQALVPVLFQRTSHQAVFGIDSAKPAAGEV